MVTELTGKKFKDFVKEGNVVIDFFADWCMPCIMMAPVLEELDKKMKNVKFGKIDVGENQKLASKYKVSSIPNFILFQNGEPKERFIGAMPIEDFKEKIESSL